MARVTYTLQEPNGRKFKVAGSANTRVLAIAEANTKVAMTVGTVLGATVSEDLAGADLADSNEGASYSDAVLVLQHTVSGTRRSIALENISNTLGDSITGDLILDDPLIVAFAAAYRDGDGGGGYEPYDGHFVA